MYEERLDDLLASWKEAFGQYAQRKTQAEQAVVRWEWTTGTRYSPLPFHFLRFPGRGRVLKDGPPPQAGVLQYGFDAQERVRVKRDYPYRDPRPAGAWQKLIDWAAGVDSSYAGPFSETFYQYREGAIEAVEFSLPPHIPLSIQRTWLENGQVVFWAHFRLNGYTPLYGQKGKDPQALYDWLGYNGRFKTAEAYHYAGERLERIAGYYECPGLGPYPAEERLTYDEAGKIQRIDRFYADGQKQVLYRKRPKGQTFKALREEAVRGLVDAIIQRVKAAQIQEPVYCIELGYLAGGQYFPPAVIPVPERYRVQRLQSGDERERYDIFMPIFEKEWFLQIDDPQTLELCQGLEQEIQAGEKWETGTKILREVAAVLTRQDWRGILEVTPDFVVFALDPEMEGDRLAEVLGSSVSKKQVWEWIDKGWLV